MTRFAGDGRTRRLRTVAQWSGRVLQFEAHRVRSEAEARREKALATWLRNQQAGLHELTLTDLAELLGYLPYSPEEKVKDFFYEAQGHLHLAARAPDGDPAQDLNLELFHSCIVDALRADAEAAGR